LCVIRRELVFALSHPRRGYLASIFSTLLSSQGADAHRSKPSGSSRGNPSNLPDSFLAVNPGVLFDLRVFSARPTDQKVGW